MNKNNISSDLLEQIKSLFDSPAEFCNAYNSYIKSRLNDITLINWFDSINEEELDSANEYLIERTSFATECDDINNDIRSSFSSLRNHCKNKDQIKAFNQLVKSFATSFSKKVSLSEFLNNSWAEDVAEELANELSLTNVDIYQIGSNEYHLISGKGTLTYRENTDYSTVEVCFYPKGKGARRGECILFDGSYGFDLDAFIYIMSKL